MGLQKDTPVALPSLPVWMWWAGWKDVGVRVGQISPGTAGERESRKGSFDPFLVVAEVLVPDTFRPLLCEAPERPADHTG